MRTLPEPVTVQDWVVNSRWQVFPATFVCVTVELDVWSDVVEVAVERVLVNVPVKVKVEVTSTISGNLIVAATETPTEIADDWVTVVVVLDEVPSVCVRAIVPFVPTCWPVLDDDCVVQDLEADGDPSGTIGTTSVLTQLWAGESGKSLSLVTT